MTNTNTDTAHHHHHHHHHHRENSNAEVEEERELMKLVELNERFELAKERKMFKEAKELAREHLVMFEARSRRNECEKKMMAPMIKAMEEDLNEINIALEKQEQRGRRRQQQEREKGEEEEEEGRTCATAGAKPRRRCSRSNTTNTWFSSSSPKIKRSRKELPALLLLFLGIIPLYFRRSCACVLCFLLPSLPTSSFSPSSSSPPSSNVATPK